MRLWVGCAISNDRLLVKLCCTPLGGVCALLVHGDALKHQSGWQALSFMCRLGVGVIILFTILFNIGTWLCHAYLNRAGPSVM